MPLLRRLLALAFVASLLGSAGCCELINKRWHSEIMYDVDKKEVAVGEEFEVSFGVLEFPDDRHYWISVSPDSVPLGKDTDRTEVPQGTKKVTLRAKEPGLHAIRVYSDRYGNPNQIAAASKILVKP